jgi:hypothetical protein
VVVDDHAMAAVGHLLGRELAGGRKRDSSVVAENDLLFDRAGISQTTAAWKLWTDFLRGKASPMV